MSPSEVSQAWASRLTRVVAMFGAAWMSIACARTEPEEGSPAQVVAATNANPDSTAAARIAFALVPGLDTAKIRVLRYEHTDSGYVFVLSEVLPPNMSQFDGDWTVLVDSTRSKARLLSRPPR